MSHRLRILDFALGQLWRHRGRTLVVVVVYALLVGLVASLLLFVEALRQESRHLLQGAPDLVVQRLVAGRHAPVPIERADWLSGIRGVADVAPRIWGYSFDPATGATLTLWGASSVPAGFLEVSAGETEERGILTTGSCVVGQGVAEARLLGLGDRLPLRGADDRLYAPRVAGLFTTPSALLTHDLVVLPEPDLRRILGLGDAEVTDLAVAVGNPREIETVARKIHQRWPDARALSRSQILATYEAAFDWRGGVWAALLAGAVLAFAILVWNQAHGLSAEEYRTLGILKAVGWSQREVMALQLVQASVVSITAMASGLVAAGVHLLWFDGALFATVLRGWSVLYPPFEPSVALDPPTLLVCLAAATLPYLAASLVPCWRAAVTDPDGILRS